MLKHWFFLICGFLLAATNNAGAQSSSVLRKTLGDSVCGSGSCGKTGRLQTFKAEPLQDFRSDLQSEAWIQDIDRDPVFLMPNDTMEEEDKELAAKRATRKILGRQLDRLMKESPLSPVYKEVKTGLRKSRQLLTFSTSGAAEGPTSTLGQKSERKISVGIDPLRRFAPTVSIGNNSRIVADPIRGEFFFEMGYSF